MSAGGAALCSDFLEPYCGAGGQRFTRAFVSSDLFNVEPEIDTNECWGASLFASRPCSASKSSTATESWFGACVLSFCLISSSKGPFLCPSVSNHSWFGLPIRRFRLTTASERGSQRISGILYSKRSPFVLRSALLLNHEPKHSFEHNAALKV